MPPKVAFAKQNNCQKTLAAATMYFVFAVALEGGTRMQFVAVAWHSE